MATSEIEFMQSIAVSLAKIAKELETSNRLKVLEIQIDTEGVLDYDKKLHAIAGDYYTDPNERFGN